MNTRLVLVDASNPAAKAIADAAAVLTRGGLVAFPTETVYGLGANALDPAAVDRIFRAKGRPPTDPVIVHIADVGDLPTIAQDIPDVALQLAQRFWPGALTLILRKRAVISDAVTAGLPTVGVRVPAHPVALALLRAARVPVAAPSANTFSRPSPTRAEHVVADLQGAVDLVLDAGPTPIGVESTVLDLTSTPPRVLRPGGVSFEALRDVLPDTTSASTTAPVSAAQPQRSPGQLLRHYAPRARLTLYVGDPARVTERMAADARSRLAAGTRVGILAPEEDLRALAPRLAAVGSTGRLVTTRYGSRQNRDEAARELFAALRTLDGEMVDEILASAPDAGDIGRAIIDRLTRAAEGRVISCGS